MTTEQLVGAVTKAGYAPTIVVRGTLRGATEYVKVFTDAGVTNLTTNDNTLDIYLVAPERCGHVAISGAVLNPDILPSILKAVIEGWC